MKHILRTSMLVILIIILAACANDEATSNEEGNKDEGADEELKILQLFIRCSILLSKLQEIKLRWNPYCRLDRIRIHMNPRLKRWWKLRRRMHLFITAQG